MKELLDSDRVNFLVWRYLLEGNYRETAAKFQKEWRIKEPHRHFDFAPHVKSHALVSVINRGLVYHSLERDYAHRQIQQGEAPPQELQQGVFGPLVAQPPRQLEGEEVEDREEEGTTVDENEGERLSRKRNVDSRSQSQLAQWSGSPTKKPRLSNGYENRVVDSATTPMEVVEPSTGENNHAYPSPLEASEPTPTPVPRTEGPDQGTQVEKVHELAPETIFLPLTPGDSPSPGAGIGALSGSPSGGNGDNAPILLHCEWNPKDPSILAAAGTDALARVWTVTRATRATPSGAGLGLGLVNGDDPSNHVNTSATNNIHHHQPPSHSLMDEGTPPTTNVTALAWNFDGTAIALATENDNKATISVWSVDGGHMQELDAPEPPVIKLRWNPNGAALLAISADSDGVLATVYQAATSSMLSYYLRGAELGRCAFDAAWITDTDFLLCGSDVLMALRCTDGSIMVTKNFETQRGEYFTRILFDWRSKLAATSSDRGFIHLWDETGQRRSISAHSEPITALQWQPLHSNPLDDERLIASGGEDCAISIWNARMPDSKAKCVMTMEEPIVALSFTPDGAFIAGATSNRVLIWKVGEHPIPRANWRRTPHPGWLSPRGNAESEEEDEYCLCWDASGQKLAYGANSRLAVIDFR